MGAGDEQLVDEILFLHRRGHAALAAAALRDVIGHRLGLGVAVVGQRHHHVLLADQIFHGQIEMIGENFGAALVAVLVAHLDQFIADHFHEPIGIGQDVEQIGDDVEHVLVFVEDLALLQPGEAVQAQIEDGLGLHSESR